MSSRPRAVLLVILANALCLGIEDYSPTSIDPVTLLPDPERSSLNAFVANAEPVFTTLFTFEAVAKIIAMGLFVNRGSYLRDGFNVLVRGCRAQDWRGKGLTTVRRRSLQDFIVVISGLAGIIPGVPNVSALRAVRVLRPLRTLSRISASP